MKFQCTLYIVLSLCILISNINHLWILYKMRLVMLKLELSLFISRCKVSIKSMRSLHLLQNLLKSFHYKFITEKLLLVDDRWVRRFYSWFYDCHFKTHTDSFVPREWTDHLNLMNVSGLVLWQDVWWAPRRKLCGFFKIKWRQDVATRADIGFVPDRWTVDLVLSIIVIFIHSNLLLVRVFKFQKLFVVLLLWGEITLI